MNWIIENWATIALLLGAVLTMWKVSSSLVDKTKKDLLEALEAIKSVAAKVKEVRGEESIDGQGVSEQEARELIIAVANAAVEIVDVVEDVISIVKEKKKE